MMAWSFNSQYSLLFSFWSFIWIWTKQKVTVTILTTCNSRSINSLVSTLCILNVIHSNDRLLVIVWGPYSLKRNCHFDEMFATGWPGSFHFDNFQRSQWQKFHQNHNTSVSVLWLVCISELRKGKDCNKKMLFELFIIHTQYSTSVTGNLLLFATHLPADNWVNITLADFRVLPTKPNVTKASV